MRRKQKGPWPEGKARQNASASGSYAEHSVVVNILLRDADTTIRSASAFDDVLRFNSNRKKKVSKLGNRRATRRRCRPRALAPFGCSPTLLGPCKRSESHASAELTSECVTDPRDYAVPLPLFRGGIINEHAVHGTARPIAAIVPDAVLADAGHDEEIRCDPLVDDA